MTEAIIFTFMVLAIFILVAWLLIKPRTRAGKPEVLSANYKQLLEENVLFYQRLNEEQRLEFETRVQQFLSTVRVNGAGGVAVEDLDRILVGASAIIPIFSFPNWHYGNIREVLLYPESFSEEFEIAGGNRPVLGMVGDGPMQQVMILSQHALREGFSNKTDKSNTAIHEFVHLIDKTDGATDGVPEILLQHRYMLPWVNMVHKNIKEIQTNKSDINPYGAKNQAEFFAVVSEYFFERPDLLKTKHPELYEMLDYVFQKKN